MNNLAANLIKPTIKKPQKVALKPLDKFESIKIFAIPSRINDKDIRSMFNGLIRLIEEKARQEQTEKYLRLKLEYSRLKTLYTNLKLQLLN
ncbi:MAG: hypothetical protein ACLRFE_02570 [Clostridia bacterium]